MTDPDKNRRILLIDDNVNIHTDYLTMLIPERSTDVRAELNELEKELLGIEEAEVKLPGAPYFFEVDSAYSG